MSDDLPPIIRDAMIIELQRELKQRQGVYTRLVQNKNLLPRDAEWRIAVIEAVIKLLEALP